MENMGFVPMFSLAAAGIIRTAEPQYIRIGVVSVSFHIERWLEMTHDGCSTDLRRGTNVWMDLGSRPPWL